MLVVLRLEDVGAGDAGDDDDGGVARLENIRSFGSEDAIFLKSFKERLEACIC
jgi:hypothetical protein